MTHRTLIQIIVNALFRIQIWFARLLQWEITHTHWVISISLFGAAAVLGRHTRSLLSLCVWDLWTASAVAATSVFKGWFLSSVLAYSHWGGWVFLSTYERLWHTFPSCRTPLWRKALLAWTTRPNLLWQILFIFIINYFSSLRSRHHTSRCAHIRIQNWCITLNTTFFGTQSTIICPKFVWIYQMILVINSSENGLFLLWRHLICFLNWISVFWWNRWMSEWFVFFRNLDNMWFLVSHGEAVTLLDIQVEIDAFSDLILRVWIVFASEEVLFVFFFIFNFFHVKRNDRVNSFDIIICKILSVSCLILSRDIIIRYILSTISILCICSFIEIDICILHMWILPHTFLYSGHESICSTFKLLWIRLSLCLSARSWLSQFSKWRLFILISPVFFTEWTAFPIHVFRGPCFFNT